VFSEPGLPRCPSRGCGKRALADLRDVFGEGAAPFATLVKPLPAHAVIVELVGLVAVVDFALRFAASDGKPTRDDLSAAVRVGRGRCMALERYPLARHRGQQPGRVDVAKITSNSRPTGTASPRVMAMRPLPEPIAPKHFRGFFAIDPHELRRDGRRD